uniref:Uncharacterized protein n=1 Tax=Arundo donax TaxID=35708 RepID=A0A0A8YQL7_ARUDO
MPQISTGIVPVRLLLRRDSCCSFFALPTSGGMIPVKEL